MSALGSTWNQAQRNPHMSSSSFAGIGGGQSSTAGRAAGAHGSADAMQELNDAVRTAVRPTSDPMAEIRNALASLTARSDRYHAEDSVDRIAPSSRSLYQLSKLTADRASGMGGAGGDGVGMNSAGHGSGTSGTGAMPLAGPANAASVELFMAQNMNFDVQAQQQLLRQIQARQAQMAADLTASDPAALGGLGAYINAPAGAAGVNGGAPVAAAAVVTGSGWGNAEVDAVVARIKSDLLLEARNEVHQREKETIREREDMLFKASWNTYYASAADELELRRTMARTNGQTLRSATGLVSAVGAYHGSQDPLLAPARINGVARGTDDLAVFLMNGTTAAEIVNGKIAAFAPIVEQHPPAQWITYFTSYVADQAVRSGDELAPLWANVEKLLEPLSRQGTAASLMTYIASSRALLERSCLKRVFSRGLRSTTAHYATEDAVALSDVRVLELLYKVHDCGGHPWRAVFFAMRAGRYDAAYLAAKDIGSRALHQAIERVATADSAARNQLPPLPDLASLYEAKETTEDPYRQAVLLLLLAGRTGENNETVTRLVSQVASRVAVNVEDSLWLRLAMLRSVEETAKGGSVQSLAFLHRIVMDDLQDVVAAMGGDVPRLANFLFHALLPSHALRTLLGHTVSYVDGIHIALCFNAIDYLQCSPLETPIDLGAHLASYSTLVLLDADRRTRATAYAGTALFSYFFKCGFVKAFEDLCLKEVICARLFGQRGAPFGSHALLLRGGQSGKVISKDLLNAMGRIADTAAARHNPVLAVHMLLVTAYAAHKSGNQRVVAGALRRGYQVAGPALVQAFRLPPSSPMVASLFAVCADLLQHLQDYAASSDAPSLGAPALMANRGGAVGESREDLFSGREAAPTPQEVVALKLLGIMADTYASEARGDLEQSVASFLSLPFVPRTSDAVDRCVTQLTSAAPLVVAGTNAVLPIFFRAASGALERYAQSPGTVQRQWMYDTLNNSGVTDSSPAIALRRTMQVVVPWVKKCCRQAGTNYQPCPPEVDQFERTFL